MCAQSFDKNKNSFSVQSIVRTMGNGSMSVIVPSAGHVRTLVRTHQKYCPGKKKANSSFHHLLNSNIRSIHNGKPAGHGINQCTSHVK